MNKYFVSYSYTQKGFINGFGCSCIEGENFNVKDVLDCLKKENDLDGATIIYFKKFEEGESF